MIKIHLLSFFIAVLSICHCYNNDNSTVPLNFKANEGEALPDPEALSFLRPTFVKVPTFLPQPPPRSHMREPIYRSVDRMDTGIDRMDTGYETRYQNPVQANRGFERRQRPFGYQTRRPEISPIRREGMNIPYGTRINPKYTNTKPNRVPYDDNQSMRPFPIQQSSSTVYTYRGDDAASVEGSGLFRHIATEDIEERFDPYDQYYDEGSLPAALKALWNYKELAYQTLLARSGAVDNDMMKETEEKVTWSNTWDPNEEEIFPNSDFSDDYEENIPFTDMSHDQSESYSNPPLSIARRHDQRIVPDGGRYSPENDYTRREGPDMYHITPRYNENPYPGQRPGIPNRRDESGFGGPRQQFAGPPFIRRGSSRTPRRMQLVNRVLSLKTDKNSVKPLPTETTLPYDYTTEPTENTPTDDVSTPTINFNNLFNDEKMTSNNDGTKTIDDAVVLNVTLLDDSESVDRTENDYYAYYVDDEANQVDRNYAEKSDDFYYVYEDEGNQHLPRELPEEGTEELSEDHVKFVYVDDANYDGIGDGGDSVIYYEDSNDHDDDDDTEYAFYAEEDSEDDETLTKRQGLFPFFGGKKSNRKKIHYRPYNFPHKIKGSRPAKVSSEMLPPPPPPLPLPSPNDTSGAHSKKNIRVRIKSKPSAKKKKIRMKIQGIQKVPNSNQILVLPSKNYEHSEKSEHGHFRPISNNKFTVYKAPMKSVSSTYNIPSYGNKFEGSTNTKTAYNPGGYVRVKVPATGNAPYGGVNLNPIVYKEIRNTNQKNRIVGYGNTKAPIYSGTKGTGYQNIKNTGHGGVINTGYGNTKNTGYGGIKTTGYGGPQNAGYGGMTLKDSVGWSAIHQMSDNLPDLNKAITVMSFIAFSIFVANLGVNALANSSLGLSFGRGDPNVFTTNPDFSVDGMINDLSTLFESKELQNGATVSTFEKVTDFVTAVYNDLHETTRIEMEKVRNKIKNFLHRDLSEDDLPVGDISKSFLARGLETETPFMDLQETCYRRLLCLAHNLTLKYRPDDQRNKLLPFWTFGIGWLKGGKSEMTDLLENLRAELAGQNGRNCRKLFAGCNKESKVEELAHKVENELKDDSVTNSYPEIKDAGRSHQNNIVTSSSHQRNSVTSSSQQSNNVTGMSHQRNIVKGKSRQSNIVTGRSHQSSIVTGSSH